MVHDQEAHDSDGDSDSDPQSVRMVPRLVHARDFRATIRSSSALEIFGATLGRRLALTVTMLSHPVWRAVA